MGTEQRYAVWLLLPGEAHDRFAALIRTLSARHGTPAFAPHVTLLAGLTGPEEELRHRTRALARELEPFELRLLEAAHLDAYYRCLFVEIGLSRALHGAHAAATQLFERRPEPGFYPHLSLVYGDLEEKEKEAILDDIGRYFDERVRVEELALYAVAGPPPSWRCVERLRLGGDGAATR